MDRIDRNLGVAIELGWTALWKKVSKNYVVRPCQDILYQTCVFNKLSLGLTNYIIFIFC